MKFIAVAVKYKDIVYVGNPFDIHANVWRKICNQEIANNKKIMHSQFTDGFLTEDHKFLARKECLALVNLCESECMRRSGVLK